MSQRTDWSQELLPKLPMEWKQNPFLLELVFETAERHADLRNDMSELLRQAIVISRGNEHKYLDFVYQEGLTEKHRQVLRSIARQILIEAPERETLRDCVLIREEDGVCEVADPVLAAHLPPTAADSSHFGHSRR